MSSLHLVYSVSAIKHVAERISPEDEVVLLGDAVYVQKADTFALSDDVRARGLTSDRTVTYADLVNLTIKHNKVVSWP